MSAHQPLGGRGSIRGHEQDSDVRAHDGQSLGLDRDRGAQEHAAAPSETLARPLRAASGIGESSLRSESSGLEIRQTSDNKHRRIQ